MSGEEDLGNQPNSTENGVMQEEKKTASSLEAKEDPDSNTEAPASEENTPAGEEDGVDDTLGAALAGMNLGAADPPNGSSTAGVSSSFLSGGDAGYRKHKAAEGLTWGKAAQSRASSYPASCRFPR